MFAHAVVEYVVFHQKEDLTTRIANILQDYPVGVGPFKEMIQNADDARARKLAVVLDESDYAHGTIISPELAQWQVCRALFRMKCELSLRDLR